MASRSGTSGPSGLNGTNGTKGSNGTNGGYTVLHSSSSNSKLPDTIKPPPGPLPPLAKAVDHGRLKANREGITSALDQFAQSIHAPQRPLPTQVGNGTYSVRKRETGLRLDLKYIGWKGRKNTEYHIYCGLLTDFADRYQDRDRYHQEQVPCERTSG